MLFSRFEAVIYDKIMLPFQIPGIQIVFSKGGVIIYDKAFGFSNVKQGTVASNSRYHRIASISKVITKLAIK